MACSNDYPFFYVWETVTFPIGIVAEDGETGLLNDLKNVIVSFGQQNVLVEKEMSEIDIDTENDVITVSLTQAETGLFKPNSSVKVQVNLLYEDSERDTTAQGTISVLANLHEEVMS